MNFQIPLTSGDNLPLTIENGHILFFLGANGSGKSALLHFLVSSNQQAPIRRISAHRRAWIESGAISLTPKSRRQFDETRTGYEQQSESRWKDDFEEARQSAALFDLVAQENSRARHIAGFVDLNDTDTAKTLSSKEKSPFNKINDLLVEGRLGITLENSNDEEIIARRRGTESSYSIAQTSDGERNAIIIAANVLTVEAGTIVMIDEPERHLHRSIIEPFLSALLKEREDCTFVISTHEVSLPVAFPDAQIVVVRSCSWANDSATSWTIDAIEPSTDIPDDIKRVILGARKCVLFVEGIVQSLDIQLYEALFSDVSVVPREGCTSVMKAVRGLRDIPGFHHVDAFGLIDRDDRSDAEVKDLSETGVFALNVCSVESLFYCSDAIHAVAQRQAETLGRDAQGMMASAIQAALFELRKDGVAERMAARRCERKVREALLSKLPKWKDLQARPSETISISVPSPFYEEVKRFKDLIDHGNLDEIVARYPLRESQVFSAIAKTLELTTSRKRKTYEATVLSRIRKDTQLSRKLKARLGSLPAALKGHSKG